VVEAGASDVAFVPVAISYDRVLEDNILVAAHERGDRRFAVRISVVLGFVLRKVWQWLTRRFSRFGYAAVVFGTPRFLSDYPRPFDVEAIAVDLMEHIRAHIPALPVPVLADLLMARMHWTRAELQEAFSLRLAEQEGQLVDASSFDVALLHLLKRGFVRDEGGKITRNAESEALLSYYARGLADHAASAKS
jgi:glycerol-3-phosphate O-acyltransferase